MIRFAPRSSSHAGVVLVMALLFIPALPADASRRRAVSAPPRPVVESAHLNAARAAAAWLESLERRGPGDTLSWPTSETATGASTGIDLGAAGIGAFHLRLYEATGERRYLEKAIGAGYWIADAYARGGGGVDWLGGRAGGGEFFLALYDATGNPRWLDEAEKAAASLIAVSRGDAQTIYWLNGQYYTSLAHGAAGIGLFFVHLHELTNDQQYLDVAMRAYRWIMQHTIPAGSGITLKRLTTDSVGYHGWCGGSVGAIIFFAELWRASGDVGVASARDALLEGLLDTAVRSGTPAEPQVAWHYGPSSRKGASRPVIYCHGAASTAAVFAREFLRSGEEPYRDTARAAGRWLDTIAIAQNSGRSWNHIVGAPYHELGFLTGTASVGHASLELYRAFREPADLERARAAAAYLLEMAEQNAPGQMKWITRTDTVGGTPRYETGWYMGAAGIGLFLLELHEAERGDVLPRRFSLVNP